MSKNEFEDLLYLITAHTVDVIMQKTGWDEDSAMEKFIKSKVYAELEQEETKAWHYSATMLAYLFLDEMNGNLVWPEVV